MLRHPKSSSPPGPKGHPVWGNIEVLTDVLSFMRDSARSFPSIASARLLNQRAWLLNAPEVIEDILVAKADKVRKHWSVRSLPIALGQGLLSSDGELYKRQRRLIQPAFRREKIVRYFDCFVSQTQAMLDRWQRDGDQEHDILQEMHTLTMNTASETLFGAVAEEDASRVRNALRVGQAEFVKRICSVLKLPLWVPTPSNRRLKKAAADLDEIIYRFIRERRNNPTGKDDLLSVLLQARDDERDSGMSDQQLRDECLTIFLAGQETSALAMSWCWYLLSQHPNAAQTIYDEVDRVLGDRTPTMADVMQLTEIENALTESMRLYPPIYVMAREPIEDLHLGGYRCRKGTALIIPVWAIHYDEAYYEAPESFRPERWRDGLAKRLPKGAYFPFSMGPRTCPGSNFAMLQMRLVMAMIAQRFRFTLNENAKVTPFAQVTLQPYPGIPTKLQQRERAYVQS